MNRRGAGGGEGANGTVEGIDEVGDCETGQALVGRDKTDKDAEALE